MAYDLTIPVSPTVLTPTIAPLEKLSTFKLVNVLNPDVTFAGNGQMDFAFDSAGRVELLSGVEKLDQEIKKIIVTQPDETSRAPDYGAGVANLVGSKGVTAHIRIFLTQVISDAVQFIKDQKDAQATTEPVLDSERITRLKRLKITKDLDDPRAWVIEMTIGIEGGDDLESEIRLVA